MIDTDMVSKINHILCGLTTCRFVFQPTDTIVSADWNANELREAKRSESVRGNKAVVSSLRGDSYGIPVFIQNSFAGLAVIYNSEMKKNDDPFELAELLTNLLELKLNNETSATSLRSLEERMTVQEGQAANVTQIRPTRLSRIRAIRRRLEEMEKQHNQDPVEKDQASLLMENTPAEDARRSAVRIHEESGRWALLSIDDLSSDTFDSRENLVALGGITLFVPDLAKLTPPQQIRLAEHLAQEPSIETPRVVAAIRTENRHMVMSHLLSLFKTHAFDGRTSTDPNQARLIPFDIRLLDQDQAPVH